MSSDTPVVVDSVDTVEKVVDIANKNDTIEKVTKPSLPNPYNSKKKTPTDWNKLAKEEADAEYQEASTTKDTNEFFKHLYKGADDDTRRAMIKSYQTSGGVSLTTNWDQAAKTDYEKYNEGLPYEYDKDDSGPNQIEEIRKMQAKAAPFGSS